MKRLTADRCLYHRRLCYVLLSPTWGMHQYTADLAGRMVGSGGAEVHVVTTRLVPRDRYAPGVAVHTPVGTRDSGFSRDGIVQAADVHRETMAAIREIGPDVVHFTGPHLWNPWLLGSLRRAGLPTVHTLHDLHPHAGAAYGRLLYAWNALVRRWADHLLVHGRRWAEELRSRGAGVTWTPLTHLFVGWEREVALRRALPEVRYEPWALFVGRLERYKGLEVLAGAVRGSEGVRAVVAGPGSWQDAVRGPVPEGLELREGLVGDDQAVELFARCGVVVLPYVEASQSALVGAAYFFRKPVVVSRVGALPEYVVEGETGWVVPPGDVGALGAALGAALACPERLARMGEAGRAWYEREREGEGQALREMYERVAGERGSKEDRERGRWVR